MAKAQLFRGLLGWGIERMGAFPVRRGNPDTRAFQTARTLLTRGETLLIFPEGTRSRDGALGPAQQGVALLAHTARAPVVPIGIRGTERALSPLCPGLRPVAAKITYGAPLDMDDLYATKADRATLEAINERIMSRIAALSGQCPLLP